MKFLNIGTLNAQGCNEELKRKSIGEDAEKYNLHLLGITETRIEKEEIEDINKKYNIYHNGITGTNKCTGVGIVIRKEIKAKFIRISDRICGAEIELDENEKGNEKKKLIIIVAYAPTLVKSESNEEIREEFYNSLNEATRKLNKGRHTMMVVGDFNAKTGSGYKNFPENMGSFGKGHINSNGLCLLEYAKENQLYLTNTTFKHKLSHKTTWTCPQRNGEHKDKDGTPRRNPYRNQIDYILTKCMHKRLMHNSRSYSGINTKSDHKMVILNMKLQWYLMKSKAKQKVSIDYTQFRQEGKIQEYRDNVKKKVEETTITEETCTDKKWEHVSDICNKSAEETLGKTQPLKRNHDDEETKRMSAQQKKTALQIISSQNKEQRKKLKVRRNNILNKIKDRLKLLEENLIEEELKGIEEKGTTQKAYDAVKALKKRKPKTKLKVFDKKGNLTHTEKEQVKIVTDLFKETFEIPDQEEIKQYPPCPNPNKFTKEEITKITMRLKNGKSPGIDDVNPELIKYAPEEIHQLIADILNTSIESEDILKVLKKGILTPLQKPPKKGYARKTNVRPIILLSVIRKIFAMGIIDRVWDKMKTKIPPEQAAYQRGRSTTEQVFAIKMLVEKAIISQDYNIILLLIDMSKAFDTVGRNKLLHQLEQILSPSEMRMMHLLIADVELFVRMGKEMGVSILTNIGVAQGDCLSALLFIFYLAHILGAIPTGSIREDHEGEILWSELDWLLRKDKHNIELDPKYADDVTFIRSAQWQINKIKRILPDILKTGNLIENESKREEYQVPSERNEWKTCKILGSLIDTEKDIQRRKGLAQDSMNTLSNNFRSRSLTINTKIRIFQAYVSSIFLYNCELWVSTKTISEKIDRFQRRLLRKVLNIKWPKKISNSVLYEKTKVVKWSAVVKRRRLTWLGHVMRLSKETPARIALETSLKKVPKHRGRTKTTWIDTIRKDMKNSHPEVNLKDDKLMFDVLEKLCTDKAMWRRHVNHMMLNTTNM